jgi:hypothetical protein
LLCCFFIITLLILLCCIIISLLLLNSFFIIAFLFLYFALLLVLCCSIASLLLLYCLCIIARIFPVIDISFRNVSFSCWQPTDQRRPLATVLCSHFYSTIFPMSSSTQAAPLLSVAGSHSPTTNSLDWRNSTHILLSPLLLRYLPRVCCSNHLTNAPVSRSAEHLHLGGSTLQLADWCQCQEAGRLGRRLLR